VEQFVGDIRRYLEGQPVLAHRDSFGYIAGKVLRRNRITVVAATLVILSASAGYYIIPSGTRSSAHNAGMRTFASSPAPSFSILRISCTICPEPPKRGK